MVHVVRPVDADGRVTAHVARERGGRVAARRHVVRRRLETGWLWQVKLSGFVNFLFQYS